MLNFLIARVKTNKQMKLILAMFNLTQYIQNFVILTLHHLKFINKIFHSLFFFHTKSSKPGVSLAYRMSHFGTATLQVWPSATILDRTCVETHSYLRSNCFSSSPEITHW